MQASIIVKDDKKNFYNIYYQDKKVKSKNQIELNSDEIITLIEQNILLDKFWWILIIFSFIFAWFGSGEDFNDIKDKQRIIKIKLGKINSDKVIIKLSDSYNNITITGVNGFEIISNIEEERPLVKKRIKYYKIILISTVVIFILSVTILILVTKFL